ncbi:MAG: winged helix-turn-helix transcriptional regulator [Chloroflexi bacterium]|nr:winged helix-turn-helix transcriptional regulator [Chloroflexota bacterium]
MDKKIRQLAREKASFCSVFGSTQRILILWAIADGEMSVSDIAKTTEASLQNTSQHLRLMKDKGVVNSRRDGQTIYYRIAENKYLKSCPILLNARQT